MKERRRAASRLPDLRELAPKLHELASGQRPVPLLYVEFTSDGRTRGDATRPRAAAYKQATSAALKAAIGSILRKGDLAAAGAGGRSFVVLLAGRTGARPASADADLGVAAERLRRAVQRELVRAGSRVKGALAHDTRVRCGWNVLEPAADPLEALRHAVRGAALLARVEERRSTVLAAVTHELRTPLTAIIGFAERLQDGQLPANDRERSLDIIIDESKRLHRLAEGLIDLGSWGAGNLRLHLRRQWLGPVAQQAKRALFDRALRKGVKINIVGNARATIDRDRCLQIFINLLDNAVRYSPPACRVDVRLRSQRGGSLVTIRDSGPGFAPRAQRALGTPFSAGADGKVGLGLAIAHLLVDAHHGALRIVQRRGGGMVTVTFPAASPPD